MSNVSTKERTLTIVTAGISIALSLILSQLKLFKMPMGGTVTPASTLPLIIFAVAFGPAWGFFASISYSLLQLLDGYIMNPIQVLLDYIISYSSLGIVGLAALHKGDRVAIRNPLYRFKRAGYWKMVLLTILAYMIRILSSVLSGIIFFSDYAPEGQGVLIYSITYNGSFLLADMTVVLVVLSVLYITLKKTLH